jgi:lipid-binding SYLF domain-containing protein
MTVFRTVLLAALVASSAAIVGCTSYASRETSASQSGASRADLHIDSNQALNELYSKNPRALELSKTALGVLVFPKMVRAGLAFGGGYGEGELRRGSTVLGRYNSVTGSWGLQAGAQSYSYVVFLMNQEAMNYLDRTDGWEIGVGPNVVVVNAGVAENISTSTEKGDAFAFIFGQQGLMAGVSIEGTKITKIAG